MLNTTPLVKGLITGGLIVTVVLFFGLNKIEASSGSQYLVYILYGAGVGWTIYAYTRSDAYIGKFGALFNQGFRCFVVVTLIMALFWAIFVFANPNIKEELAAFYRADLEKMKEVLPNEIDEKVKKYRESLVPSIVSFTVFQYLLMGTIFTLAWSVFFILRRKNSQ
jgi:hypothetical protein